MEEKNILRANGQSLEKLIDIKVENLNNKSDKKYYVSYTGSMVQLRLDVNGGYASISAYVPKKTMTEILDSLYNLACMC